MRFYRLALIFIYLSVFAHAGEKADKNWYISTSLGNSVGIGSFVSGYAAQPSWSTSLSISPSYQFDSFEGLPGINISASESIGFWWLNSYSTGIGDQATRLSLSDLSLDASMSGLLNHEELGLSLGTGVSLLLPVSKLSRNIGRIFSLGLSMPMSWRKSNFNVSWTPSVSGWVYSQSYYSGPCFEMLPAPINNLEKPNAEVEQLMQGFVLSKRESERMGDGQCILSGRQSVFSLDNFLSAGWSKSGHSISLGLGWFLNFLRPLESRPELKAQYASGQNFSEATLGRIVYAYKVPIEQDFNISGGIVSVQGSYAGDGSLRFPFFDFSTPNNNFTQFFIQATVGI